MGRLIEFYGAECEHCKELTPVLERIQQELGVEIVKLEVWHNEENCELMKSYDRDAEGNEFCGGIPFFYNENTGKKLCGMVRYERLKAWAEGK
jgi:thiol-disulfide isomerase/thioredoxin